MLNMLEKMWKREYKIGTRKHEGYVVQSNGLHSWRKLYGLHLYYIRV